MGQEVITKEENGIEVPQTLLKISLRLSWPLTSRGTPKR
jgi:hypothetical protein